MHARFRKIWPDIVDSDDSDVENEIDVDKLPPLEVGPGENRLQHTYCLWFSRKGTQRAAADYSKSLHVVGRCASVQQWWSLYSHLIRPTALKPFRELSLFKQGIKPMWEDPANSKGGQWVIRLRKNKIERAWENVCMAMLGEQSPTRESTKTTQTHTSTHTAHKHNHTRAAKEQKKNCARRSSSI